MRWGTLVALTVVLGGMWGDVWWLFGAGCVLFALVVVWSVAFQRRRLNGFDAAVLAGTGLTVGVASVWWARSIPETTVFHPVIASYLLALLYMGLAVSVAVWRWAGRR